MECTSGYYAEVGADLRALTLLSPFVTAESKLHCQQSERKVIAYTVNGVNEKIMSENPAEDNFTIFFTPDQVDQIINDGNPKWSCGPFKSNSQVYKNSIKVSCEYTRGWFRSELYFIDRVSGEYVLMSNYHPMLMPGVSFEMSKGTCK